MQWNKRRGTKLSQHKLIYEKLLNWTKSKSSDRLVFSKPVPEAQAGSQGARPTYASVRLLYGENKACATQIYWGCRN